MSKARQKARPTRRAGTRPARSLFIDESGFTGPDLLERAQPFVAYAAVEIEEKRAASILAESRARYFNQGSEFKASKLLKHERGRRQVLDVLKALSSEKMRITVHNKRYGLAAKFVEYILEPALSRVWAVLYRDNFHQFVAMLLYAAMERKDADADRLMLNFSDFMRGRDDAALWDLLDTQTPQHAFLQDLAAIARAYREEILRDRANAHSVLDVPAFVMDLTSTSILGLLMSMPHRDSVRFVVTLDDSRAMQAAATELEAFPRGAFDVVREGRIQFASSAERAGIQIADLAAGAALHVYNERAEYEMFEESLQRRMTEYNLDPMLTDVPSARHNADILNMVANNIRAGRDPVARLETLIRLALAAQQNSLDAPGA
jgi:hypothetical protein